MGKKMMRTLVAMVLTIALAMGCVSSASAWEPQWKHDEDLSSYKLCDNFGDIKLRFAVTSVPAIIDWETNEYVKWIEDVTNVDLSFELIPYDGRAEKLGLLLASGDYPDVFLSVGMTNQMISRYGVDEQMFLPLNDLINQYGTFTKQIFEEYPGSENAITQLDGKIYSLPVVNECYHATVPTKFWMNQTWLDNLGLKQPTTLDELYNVLVAFRDQDANGNGDPSDEIPLAGDYFDGWYTNPERFIMNAFTYYNLDLDKNDTSTYEAFGLYMNGDTVTTPFADPEFKKGVAYVAKMVKEGLIYEGSFTQDLAGLTQLAESGRLGTANGGYILFADLGGDVYKQYRAVMPVKGPEGYQGIISFPYDSVSGNMFTISADCKNPEAAFKIGDMLYSYAASMRGYYGVYNNAWTDADADAVGINGEPALYKLLKPWQETEPQNDCVLQMTTSRRDSKFRLGEPSDPNVDLYSAAGLETLLYQVTKDYKPYADDSKALPTIKFTEDENAELSVLMADLSTAIKEGMLGFFTGSKDVDTEFDSWLQDLNSKGLSRLTEIYQNEYNAQFK
jgi:putative aldouronate transport system substrate-binding protein